MKNEKVQKGDLVEAVRGERVVVDRVLQDPEGDLYLPGAGYLTNHNADWVGIERSGYSWEILERAKAALPTKPGYYRSRSGNIYYLGLRGDWTEHRGRLATLQSDAYVMEHAMPLVSIQELLEATRDD